MLHRKTCELLIAKGADVTIKEMTNSTALHLAAKAGSLKTARALLNCLLPSTMDERDNDQNTPLHIACRYNRVDVVRFLLDEGADVTARNARNMTCLDIAIEWEYEEVAKTLARHPRLVKCFDCLVINSNRKYMKQLLLPTRFARFFPICSKFSVPNFVCLLCKVYLKMATSSRASEVYFTSLSGDNDVEIEFIDEENLRLIGLH